MTVMGLNGCVMVNQYNVGKRPVPVRMSSCGSAPSLTIRTNFDADHHVPGLKSTANVFRKSVERVAEETGSCFSKFEVDPSTGTATDFVVHLDLRLHNDPGKEFAVGFLSGITFFLLPVWITYPFTLQYEVVNKAGEKVVTRQLDDSMRLVQQLFLLPGFPTVVIAQNNLYENIVRAALSDTDWNSLVSSQKASLTVFEKRTKDPGDK
jgi:hypothetical protein